MNVQGIRSSKKARLWVIGGLIVLAAVALFFVKATWAKVAIGAVIALLVAAFGVATRKDLWEKFPVGGICMRVHKRVG